MMKNSIIFLVLIFLSVQIVGAQKLDSKNYHTHRSPLKNSFQKFQSEKKGRVAFLGGSITYNPGWRDSVCNYLQQKFPETEFDFVAAGIPSQGSTPGAFRFERDVLANGKVDLLFEEAAVNDHVNFRTNEEILLGIEGIIRHAKIANPKCDVVLMHFVDPDKMKEYRSGNTPEVILLHNKVAEHYKIPSINLAKEVTDRIDAGEFDWENDFKDLHPSPFGQNIYAQSIKVFLEMAYSKDFANSEDIVLPTALNEGNYSGGVLIEPNPPRKIKGWEFEKNWKPQRGVGTRDNYRNVPMLVGTYPGKVVKFDFEGSAIGIAVAAGPDAGIIEYSIDNSDWKKQDLYTQWSKSLYLPWYFTLESGLKNKKHTLQIRVAEERNQESTGNSCILRYFYFNKAD